MSKSAPVKHDLIATITTFGELLRYLRQRAQLTQRDLALATGYSISQISRLEHNERLPDEMTLLAVFVPALGLEQEPATVERLLALARRARSGGASSTAPPETSHETTIDDGAAPQNAPRMTSFVGRASESAEVSYLPAATPPLWDAPVHPSSVVSAVATPVKRHAHNLPTPANRLVGRRQQITEIQALLQRTDVGLVTLTGPGGIGKTRLALQVAHEFVAAMLLECWFVDLAPVQAAALVIPTILQTLGVSAPANQPALDSLKHYLHPRQVLLLLDNFEHVVDAAPQISELLAFASGLKVLVTSRMVLHLAGEYECSVPPLTVPTRIDPADLAALAQCEAVTLLLERALANGAKITLTPKNAADIANICVRLEGLPLALELAAARCKLFTPKELLTRLERRLPILTTGARDQPGRQQTLRATLDWSYQLLRPPEQILFARLGIFVGGFTWAAAEAVCHGPSDFPVDIVESIAALLDQSLIRPLEDATGERRFLMLETIREYAREKLVARGEEDALCAQHAAYFLELAEQAEPLLLTDQQQIWYQRLILEQSNFRAALHWWRVNNQYLQVARLGAALCWFWLKHGELREEMPRLEWALAEIDHNNTTPPAIRAKALYSVGAGASWFGDFARARKLFEECLQIEEGADSWYELCNVLDALAEIVEWEGDYPRATLLLERYLALSRAHNFTNGMANGLTELGELVRLQGDYPRAIQLLQESLILCKAVGTVVGIATAQGYLGIATRELGDFPEAQRLLEEALQLATMLDDKMLSGGITTELGVVAHLLHDYEKAHHYQQQALKLLTELDFQAYIALALARLGNLALSQADGVMAHAYYTESLAIAQRIATKRSLAAGLEGLAAVAIMNEQPHQAAHLLSAADACRQSIGIARPIEERILYAQTITATRAALGEAQFAAACLTGRTTALDDVIAQGLT